MRIVAVLLNLLFIPGVGHVIPGTGHVVIGRWRRGLPWALVALLTPLVALTPAHPFMLFGLIAALKIGSAIEVGILQPTVQRAPLKMLAIGAGGLIGGILWASLSMLFVLEGFRIPSGAMVPTLHIGDHIFVSKLAYRFGEPARGDLAVFVNPCEPDKDFVKRIVGLPGDTIEVRCDVLYINGVAAPATSLKEDCAYWDQREYGGPWMEASCVTYVETIDGHEHEIVHDPARRERDQLRKLVAGERSYEDLQGDGDFPEIGRLPACPDRGEGTSQPVGQLVATTPPPGAAACTPRMHYVVPAGHIFFMGDNRENSSDSRNWGPVPRGNLKGKVVSIWWAKRKDELAWDRIGPID